MALPNLISPGRCALLADRCVLGIVPGQLMELYSIKWKFPVTQKPALSSYEWLHCNKSIKHSPRGAASSNKNLEILSKSLFIWVSFWIFKQFYQYEKSYFHSKSTRKVLKQNRKSYMTVVNEKLDFRFKQLSESTILFIFETTSFIEYWSYIVKILLHDLKHPWALNFLFGL